MQNAISNTGSSRTSSAGSARTGRRPAGWILNMQHGLPCLFLFGCLSACAGRCPPPPAPEVVEIRPSESLLLPTPRPALLGTDNGALEELVDEYDGALDQCNADKEAARNEVKKPAADLSHTPDPTPAASKP